MNAPWKMPGAATHEPFHAYVCDDASFDALRAVAIEMGWAPEKVAKGGLRNAIQSLSVSASPAILFVDISESPDPLNDINGLAEVCEPGTVVIAAGQINDVRLYRELLTSGIHDYLLKPLQPEMLRDAFASAHAILNAPRMDDGAAHPHMTVAVIGTRGGCGASTLATSLSWLMSEKGGRQTALLDLDVHFGTDALTMDVEPGRGLIDAIENPARIDGLFIERAMVKANDTLSILSAEAPLAHPLTQDGSAFHQLQEELRLGFEVSVLDLPRHMLVQHPHLLHEVNAIILVTELTLAAARDTIRLLSWLKTTAPQASPVIVANRVQSSNVEISRKDFEQSIERPVNHVIAFEPKLAVTSAKLGKTFAEVAKDSKSGALMQGIMSDLLASIDMAGEDRPGNKAANGDSLLARIVGMARRAPRQESAAAAGVK